ncbi:MAG: DUF1848 domain-containing protein [Spirochaetaceae bacterium]|nr:DUF1848 domain-containing protein [Spirochaetaceae bacterium]
MILSASRRTDIPAFYTDWFLNRIKERYVLSRNPINPRQVSKIDLSPELIDCIVFWTKNPAPLIVRLKELEAYHYYFQFTLNAYEADVEPGLASKHVSLVNTFMHLSERIGKERVIWRYDPMLLTDRYTVSYHIQHFTALAKKLKDATQRCVISFIDFPKRISRAMSALGYRAPDFNEMHTIARAFSGIASENGITLETCAEAIDLSTYGISHGKCIDDALISRISGKPLHLKQDPNQRAACSCVPSVDIGLYNTCMHGCKYCYASFNKEALLQNREHYDEFSPILCSKTTEDDVIRERKDTQSRTTLQPDLPFVSS